MSRRLFDRRCDSIQAGFYVDSSNPVSFSLGYNDSILSGVFQIRASGTFFMTCTGVIGGTQYASLTTTIENTIEANLSAIGASSTVICSFDPRRGKFWITTDYKYFDYINIKPGVSQNILGFRPSVNHAWGDESTLPVASGAAGLGYYVSGSMVPYYVWRSGQPAKANWKKPYEPNPWWTDVIGDDGNTYSISHDGPERWSEWVYPYEEENHVRRSANRESPLNSWSGNPIEPWTWQDFVEYVRGNIPFIVHTASIAGTYPIGSSYPSWDNKEAVYCLRGQESNFDPRVPDVNYQNQINLPVKVRVLGTGSQNYLNAR